VSGATRTFIKKRPGGTVDVDDAFESVVELREVPSAPIEASRFALGRKNGLTFEINGSKGSIRLRLERFERAAGSSAGFAPGS